MERHRQYTESERRAMAQDVMNGHTDSIDFARRKQIANYILLGSVPKPHIEVQTDGSHADHRHPENSWVLVVNDMKICVQPYLGSVRWGAKQLCTALTMNDTEWEEPK